MNPSISRRPPALHALLAVAPFLPYPLIFGGGVFALVSAYGSVTPYLLIGIPVLVGGAAAVVALERWVPHSRAWQRDHDGDSATDRAHFVLNVGVSQAATLLYGTALGFIGGTERGPWPHHWPFWVQFLLALLALDLGLYVVHRASHGVGWLWRLHAVHHSPRRVYWMNGQRRHVVHELLEGTPGLLALGLLGATPAVVACALATVTLHLMFQHGNIRYRAGILRHVFAVAELHRWHHQRRWKDVQGNYAAVFSFWDALFGTALNKVGDAPLDVGMDDEPTLPADFAGQLRWPFGGRPRPQ